MFELKVYLSGELDKRFRRIAMSVYGYGRGSLSKAAEEAFTRWCAEHEPSGSSVGTNPPSKLLDQDTKASARPGIDPDERKDVEHSENKVHENDSVRPAGSEELPV